MSDTPDDPQARYRLLDDLGRGGMGMVTRRFDRRLRRQVALKESIADTARGQRLLVHEARLLAYLDHPGVVQVFDLDGGDDQASYAMKVLSGPTLAHRLDGLAQAGETMSVGDAVRGLAQTMANAHDKGVVHLDLKPGNLVLQPYGQLVVIDWGLARFHDPQRYREHLQHGGEPPEELELDGPWAGGTPDYMPPEQFVRYGDPPGPAADVFAAGCILYECLTGVVPFARGRDMMQTLHLRMAQPALPAVQRRPEVPPGLSDLCMRMIDNEVGHRPAGFAEVIAELDALSSVERRLTVRTLVSGEVLFRAGEAGEVAYRVLSGGLRIQVPTAGGDRVIAERGPGEVVGEMSLLSSAPRSATAVAVGPTRLAQLDRDEIERELARVDPLIAHLLRSLSNRLRESMPPPLDHPYDSHEG
jgi:serine/threonine protein kinase